MVMDSELKDTTYTTNFNRDMDDNMKKIVMKYHPHKERSSYSCLKYKEVMNWKHVS